MSLWTQSFLLTTSILNDQHEMARKILSHQRPDEPYVAIPREQLPEIYTGRLGESVSFIHPVHAMAVTNVTAETLEMYRENAATIFSAMKRKDNLSLGGLIATRRYIVEAERLARHHGNLSFPVVLRPYFGARVSRTNAAFDS